MQQGIGLHFNGLNVEWSPGKTPKGFLRANFFKAAFLNIITMEVRRKIHILILHKAF